ncbi:type II secretion system minor pseudopilin GspK [Pseudomonas cannabina]|uniref:Type II secretion system protein K n=3 Tax=Pseudomonas syringae group TaxID=136849 RepID=A0A3M3Q193_PSECA|nr:MULTISPECIES: type II secretion system minor pseudopilin GspK [Pseudomonas syringae group]KPB71626.1 Type II secretion system protein K [Pseudomonas syringae pv. maculicola]MBM0138475.1 type II secretion system minor pseudopilin GspK [Pseudomonas cannabina pv. alisalensis]QHE97535.1 type II secretion system minor pseudopilin GspK [Pseudomonas syringae pv. maculicola str. ES4326]QQN24211.1 type II secretion system minor pseudopilin GspK [Pseudomonas cannabina pv. alisalensis]RMN77912.1 Type 
MTQRGSAIISALLIAALVAVMAAGMLSRQSVLTRVVEAEQSHRQGSAVLLGGLEVGRRLLWESRWQDGLTLPDQAWARPIGHDALDQLSGDFQGQLEDQQGKFNLRNLIANHRPDLGQLRSFERLCATLGIDVVLSRRISQRVMASYPQMQTASGLSDSPAGVDRDTPSQTTVPATRPMLRSVDDLRGLQGLSELLLERLGHYVSILPGNTLLNGNTTSAEVLAAVVPGLSLTKAQAVIAERNRGVWFTNRGDILNRLQVPTLSIESLDVGVASDWFILRGQARQDRRRVSLQALIHRSEERMPQVIWSRTGV